MDVPDNIQCEYPSYPWNREWSQHYIYQWHLVEHGPPWHLGFQFGPASVRKTLAQIEKIDRVTRGVPKVILLCGWQQFVEGKVTWDTQFPSFTATDKSFKDDSIGPTPNDAIRWLMREAKKFNTLVSFHLDFALAQQHSALWQKYRDLDLLCKNEKGEIRHYGHWEGRVHLQREFDAGVFQERLEDFIRAFPEILDTGCVHNDWNCSDTSPWHGYTHEDDTAAMGRCMAWLKQAHGLDTCGELVTSGSYGTQFLALSFYRLDFMRADPVKVPAYIFCGGHGGQQIGAEGAKCYTPGALVFPNDAQLVGASNQGEFGYHYTNDEGNPEFENNLFRDFCCTTLPWYYLNRLLRLSFDENPGVPHGALDGRFKSVQFSDNVKSFMDEDGKVRITRDGHPIRIGNDVFIPALWKTNREIIAWSDGGYKARRWKLPAEWRDVAAVDFYDNTLNGVRLRKSSVNVDGAGFLELSLSARDGVVIVPAGADPNNAGEPLPPSGTAVFLCQDAAAPVSRNAPGNAKVRTVSGDAGLHAIVDVDVGAETRGVSLFFEGAENEKRRVAVDVIDANSIQRLGVGTTRILDIGAAGVRVAYAVSGRVRFRVTRFHYEHYGRGDGNNEAAPVAPPALFFDAP